MAEYRALYETNWLAEDDRLGRQSLLYLLLGNDDSSGLIAEPEMLEFARRSVFRRELAAAARGRREIPPRRHLRD